MMGMDSRLRGNDKVVVAQGASILAASAGGT